MSSIRCERVAFAYASSVPLLTHVELHLERGFTGVVGENGAGKSTLLALLAGELAPSSGRVHHDPRGLLVARCPQDVERPPSSEPSGKWRGLLALDEDELARWDTLSPGERRRWQLACALSLEPEVLLLDEPTNHVDEACRASLIGALRRFGGIGLVVSHDRALLDELTTATIRVYAGIARRYTGGYSVARASWEAERARARELRGAAIDGAARAERQLARAREDQRAAQASRRGQSKGRKDHDATTINRTNELARAEARLGRRVQVARATAEAARAAIPDGERVREVGRSVFVDHQPCPRRVVLELDVPALHVGDRVVLREVRVAVRPRDRVHVAGPNGTGKSTLLRALLSACTLPQDRLLVLPQELSREEGRALLDEARRLPREARGRVLSLVAALGADPDRMLASAQPSHGEARKLALALGLGRQAWCVVLDEPTNHLDLPSIERVEHALADYPGALVLVSHDERFARALTETRWLVENERVVQ